MFNLFLNCFTKKYFQLQDRASRKEYISFFLFNLIVEFLINILSIFIYKDFELLSYCYLILSTIPAITLTVRRLHDINYSGYWNLVIIPIIILLNIDAYTKIVLTFSAIYTIFLIFMKGTLGPNKYGEPPKD